MSMNFVNHRDAMNTEKGKSRRGEFCSLDRGCSLRAEPLVFLSTTTPQNPRVPRGVYPWPDCSPSAQIIVAHALFFVPEGPQRKLAGGKSAQRARPPVAPPNEPCPSGASKNFLASSSPRQFRHPSPPRAIFFDAPLGHRATRAQFRGLRPLTRTCPRLISSGVPPGREPRGDTLKQELGGCSLQPPPPFFLCALRVSVVTTPVSLPRAPLR